MILGGNKTLVSKTAFNLVPDSTFNNATIWLLDQAPGPQTPENVGFLQYSCYALHNYNSHTAEY